MYFVTAKVEKEPLILTQLDNILHYSYPIFTFTQSQHTHTHTLTYTPRIGNNYNSIISTLLLL